MDGFALHFPSIHRRVPDSLHERSLQIHNVVNWCIAASVRQGFVTTPHLTLRPSLKSGASFISPVTGMRRGVGAHTRPRVAAPGYILHSNVLHLGHVSTHRPTSRIERLVLRLLCNNLQRCVAELRAMAYLPAPHVEIEVRRVFESFSLLHRIGTEPSMLGEEWYLDGLRTILCDAPLEHRLDTHAPSLRVGAFKLACRYAAVSYDKAVGQLGKCHFTNS